eukprot:1568225-Pleurochrysis_carterae.AAC.1
MAASGTLFRKSFSKPSFVEHLTYHPPILGKLQSSNADVEAELNILRNLHLNKRVLFVGGNGLSIIRASTTCSATIRRLISKAPPTSLPCKASRLTASFTSCTPDVDCT